MRAQESLKDASHLYEVEFRAYHLQRKGFRISELKLSSSQSVVRPEKSCRLILLVV